jgi:hypothetical protein
MGALPIEWSGSCRGTPLLLQSKLQLGNDTLSPSSKPVHKATLACNYLTTCCAFCSDECSACNSQTMNAVSRFL